MLSHFEKIYKYIWPKGRYDIKFRIVLALSVLILAKIITVLVPYFYKWATDSITGNNSMPAMFPLAVFTPIVLIISFGVGRTMMVGFSQLRDAIFAKVGQNAVRAIGRDSFKHIHKLSLRFHLDRKTGKLNRIVDRGMKGIENILRLAVLNTFPTVFEFLFVAIILLYQFDWRYLLVVVIVVFSYVIFTFAYSSQRNYYRKQMNLSDEEANYKSVDALLNFETVKHFNNEKMEADRFESAMEGYEKSSIKVLTSLSILNFGQTLIFTIGLTVCMVMSGMDVMSGTQTIGDFVMINALLMQLAIPLNFFGFIYREVSQGLVDLNSLISIMSINPEIKDKVNASPLKINSGQISFNNVSFYYNKKRNILRSIDFNIPQGSSLAIVGPTGAGKSTISKLLFRFYDITSGSIKIDSQDIRDITQDSLRRQIGIVPQDTVLFNDTIEYNIKYGKIDASKEEVETVIDQSQLREFINSLPDGLNTIVGERGLKLSGGEKQRVAIARAILKNPRILVLDEATSSLDTLTEKEIKDSLVNLSKKQTTLIIAHRLSTVISADKILVLNKGELVEEGDHKSLLKKNGLYSDMWFTQQDIEKAEETLKKVKPEYKKLINK